jgi:hypothetical protein
MVCRQDYVDTIEFADVAKPGFPMMAPEFHTTWHDMPDAGESVGVVALAMLGWYLLC